MSTVFCEFSNELLVFRYFGVKIKCQWIGLFHSLPGGDSQETHRDGKYSSQDYNSLAVSGTPRVPGSITIAVPLDSFTLVASEDVNSDCESDVESGAVHRNSSE